MTVAFKRQPCSTPFDLMMSENRPRIYKLPIPHQHDCKPAKTSFYEKKLQKWNCLPGKFVPGNFNTYHLESMTCFGVADLVAKNPSNQTCWIRRSCENQGIKHPEPGPFFPNRISTLDGTHTISWWFAISKIFCGGMGTFAASMIFFDTFRETF